MIREESTTQVVTPAAVGKAPREHAAGPLRTYGDQLRADLEFGRLLRLGVIAALFTLIVAAFRLTNIEHDGV